MNDISRPSIGTLQRLQVPPIDVAKFQPVNEFGRGSVETTYDIGGFRMPARERFWKRWGPGPMALFLMLNPSTASTRADDPTTIQCTKLANAWGCGGFEVANLHLLQSPHPRELTDWLRRMSIHEARALMMRAIDIAALLSGNAEICIAAWGNGIGQPEDFLGKWPGIFADSLAASGVELHHLGLTGSGAPKHPLARGKHRISIDTKPVRWDRLQGASA